MSQPERWITEDGAWSWDGARWRRVMPKAVPLGLTIAAICFLGMEALLVLIAFVTPDNNGRNIDIWMGPVFIGVGIVAVGLGFLGAGIITWLIRRGRTKGTRIWAGAIDPTPTAR